MQKLLENPLGNEPGLRGMRRALKLLDAASGAQGPDHQVVAKQLLAAIAYAYEMARLDRKWKRKGNRVRVVRNLNLRPEHFREADRRLVNWNAMADLWPFFPWLVEFWRWLERRLPPHLTEDVWMARATEVAYIAILTKPWDGTNSEDKPSPGYWVVERVALEAQERFKKRFRDLDDLAGPTIDTYKQRRSPVRAYIPRAMSEDEALDIAYSYIRGALRNAMNDHVRRVVDPSVTTNESTLRRWKKSGYSKLGLDAIKAATEARKRHDLKEEGLWSEAQIARELGMSRGAVRNARKRAQSDHNFEPQKRGSGLYVTTDQKRLISTYMGAPRKRKGKGEDEPK